MGTQATIQGHPLPAVGWRSRLGLKAQIAAGALVLLAAGVFAGNAYLSQQYGPEGAARHYFAAVQSGDAAGAFADLEIGAPATATDAKAVDQAAMAAALHAVRPSFPGLDVGGASVSGSVAILTASYEAAGGRKQLHLTLARANGARQFGIYPRWKIAVLAQVLKISVPAGSPGIQLDSVALALAGGRTSAVAVLPMPHTVVLPATAMTGGATTTVDATLANPDGYSVAFAPKLTAAGQNKAAAAIKAVFATCAAATSASPNGCPQSYPTERPVQYQLIGDPSTDLAFGTDKQGQLTASGHYLFSVAGEASTGAVSHGISGNGYTARLTASPSDVSVASVADDNNVPPAARPTVASDEAAKSLVQQGMAACAGATDALPVDCPQSDLSAYRQSKNVHWSLNGDPLAGANTSWDGNLGALSVKGSFSMSIEYDGTFLGAGHYREPSDTKSYTAFLIVDGGSLRLITIAGS